MVVSHTVSRLLMVINRWIRFLRYASISWAIPWVGVLCCVAVIEFVVFLDGFGWEARKVNMLRMGITVILALNKHSKTKVGIGKMC